VPSARSGSPEGADTPEATLLHRTVSYLDREIETTANRLAFLEWQRRQAARELAAIDDTPQGRQAVNQ
jgi:hypothetical protein